MQSDEQNVQVVEAQQTMQSKKMCKRVDQQQQAGGYPESEALNNHDYIGHNGPGDSYVNSAAQLVTQPQHQNGHYQPQLNVPVETLQRGDISNDFEQKQSKRMCTSFGQQQAGRVKRHCPAESEALNNPNTGNETAVNQQRSSKARATTRSLYEWEQYESEQ
ncbi:unnamed protein product [Eruca vesicaria subsp. sativa]|uniref:Uncharacterized protein n=1 Tax=Eruca vesicaria subsp. sativa TaxID=29727 RepID=A0ABC8LQI5_ERUVS|nr:unnamed protein product [Eruca vesicaria subsp. sativa]